MTHLAVDPNDVIVVPEFRWGKFDGHVLGQSGHKTLLLVDHGRKKRRGWGENMGPQDVLALVDEALQKNACVCLCEWRRNARAQT